MQWENHISLLFHKHYIIGNLFHASLSRALGRTSVRFFMRVVFEDGDMGVAIARWLGVSNDRLVWEGAGLLVAFAFDLFPCPLPGGDGAGEADGVHA